MLHRTVKERRRNLRRLDYRRSALSHHAET